VPIKAHIRTGSTDAADSREELLAIGIAEGAENGVVGCTVAIEGGEGDGCREGRRDTTARIDTELSLATAAMEDSVSSTTAASMVPFASSCRNNAPNLYHQSFVFNHQKFTINLS